LPTYYLPIGFIAPERNIVVTENLHIEQAYPHDFPLFYFLYPVAPPATLCPDIKPFDFLLNNPPSQKQKELYTFYKRMSRERQHIFTSLLI
jgi:hypothetical protein